MLSFSILAAYLLLEFIHRPGSQGFDFKDGTVLPRVSILKPVSNMDDGMEANLETFFTIDYPAYEVIFGLDTDDAACRELIEKVIKKYPAVNARLILCRKEKKLNPKITTLSNIEPHASGDIFWMTDSNVRVESDTLKLLVREYLENGSKIVFSPIIGSGSETLGSIIENSYLNYFVSGSIIAGWKIAGEQIIVGKSMLIEKETLLKFGGFTHFKEYLAEDFIMGRVYTENKFHVSMNYTWVTNYISRASISKFWHRVVRWAKIRYNTERLFYFIEIILNPIAIAFLFIPFTGARGLVLFLSAAGAKIVLEYLNLFVVNGRDARKLRVLALYPVSVLLKDFLLFFIYLSPFFSKEVFWRGMHIKIDNMGKIVSINSQAKA